mmetsp:Transcript_30338/g.102366  ORF Transcript_30338/g.102366 Transcript_30338/m.102366 type:complete len:284 (-) Transcript_30338:1204-2055(-)
MAASTAPAASSSASFGPFPTRSTRLSSETTSTRPSPTKTRRPPTARKTTKTPKRRPPSRPDSSPRCWRTRAGMTSWPARSWKSSPAPGTSPGRPRPRAGHLCARSRDGASWRCWPRASAPRTTVRRRPVRPTAAPRCRSSPTCSMPSAETPTARCCCSPWRIAASRWAWRVLRATGARRTSGASRRRARSRAPCAWAWQLKPTTRYFKPAATPRMTTTTRPPAATRATAPSPTAKTTAQRGARRSGPARRPAAAARRASARYGGSCDIACGRSSRRSAPRRAR